MLTFLLFSIAVLALVVLAIAALAALFVYLQHGELDALSRRLAAEERIEYATRATLRAMAQAARITRP